MRVAFHCMDEEMLGELIVSMLRPTLEYAALVWSLHVKKCVMKQERRERLHNGFSTRRAGWSCKFRLEKWDHKFSDPNCGNIDLSTTDSATGPTIYKIPQNITLSKCQRVN